MAKKDQIFRQPGSHMVTTFFDVLKKCNHTVSNFLSRKQAGSQARPTFLGVYTFQKSGNRIKPTLLKK